MVLVAVQFHPVGNLLQLPVHPHVQVALLPDALEQLLVMSLPVLDHRGEDIARPRVILFQDKLRHLVVRVLHHPLARHIAVCVRRPREKQAEEIIYLRHSPHRRARVLVHGLLLYRYHWRQPRHLIHVRPLHVPHEMPCVSRECFDIPPLPFGINRVERQRRLPATAQTGYDGQ